MSETWAHALPWLKAIHIVAVISWMAGLLYLPRLFVYHCEAAPGSETSETFKVMEDKLSRLILFPAMCVSVGLGLGMLALPGYWAGATAGGQLWLWAKLIFVVGLLIMHRKMIHWRNDFAADRNPHPQRFFRIANEVPTLLMLAIVILVVVRPF
jgi:protoporphyrinogen IX oxidase